METMLQKHRFRIVFVVAALIALSVFGLSHSSSLRGSLTDDQVLMTFDTNHDGAFSFREMRKSIATMIRAMVTHDLAYDLNADGVTDRSDIRVLITSIRAYLRALCGNGTIEPGEKCDDGNTTTGDGCSPGCAVEANFSCTKVSPSVCFAKARYAYVVSDGVLQIVDVSDASNPLVVGAIGVGERGLGDVAVQGTYAYVTNARGNTLNVVNVLDPHNPVIIATVPAGLFPVSIAIQGTYAYVVNSGNGMLQTFDLSNPVAPQLINTTSAREASNSSTPTHISIHGHFAYVLLDEVDGSGIGDFWAFDLKNPRSPEPQAFVRTNGSPHVAVDGTGKYAYAANGYQDYLDIYDLSSPDLPVETAVHVLTALTGLRGIAVQGSYAYIVGDGGLQVFDLKIPTSPVSVATVPANCGYGASDIAVQGTFLYVLCATGRALNTTGGLEIFDLQNPTAPVSVGKVDKIGEWPFIFVSSSDLPSLVAAPAAICGNGTIEPGEQCDDHNTTSGDGCSALCTVETNFACTSNSPSVCTVIPVCGNGEREAREECDDGNIANGDGCNDVCKDTANPIQVRLVGSVQRGDAVSYNVFVTEKGVEDIANWVHEGAATGLTGIRGTIEILVPAGLTYAYSSECRYSQTERIIRCDFYGQNQLTTRNASILFHVPLNVLCGSEIKMQASFKLWPSGANGQIYPPPFKVYNSAVVGTTVLCPAACGNGSLEQDEACDDGNTTSGDGCSTDCKIESGYTCTDSPSVCHQL